MRHLPLLLSDSSFALGIVKPGTGQWGVRRGSVLAGVRWGGGGEGA